MATGPDRTENETERLYAEVNGQLNRARALLATAHRYAVKMPLGTEDQEKCRAALSEAIGLCVTVTHTAKANQLYRMPDSGLNPSELRHAIERALKPANSAPPKGRPSRESGRGRESNRDHAAMPGPSHPSLMAQLNACRRMNIDALRWLAQAGQESERTWRGAQLMKIAEQLCVVTALESKLLGVYVLGASHQEPATVRKFVNTWATEMTRQELADE